MSDPAPTQLCTGCLLDRPLTSFRCINRATGRMSTRCRICRNADESRRRKRKSKSARTRAFRHAATELSHAEDAQTVLRILGLLFRRYGGPERFISKFVEHLTTAEEKQPGSRTVLVAYNAVASMMLTASQSKPSADVETLSDEALQTERLRLACEIIAEQPELAIVAAEKLGWRIERPSEAA